MKNKKVVFTFIASSLLFALIFFGVLFVYDPLKLFHNQGKYKDYIQENMAEQAAGIINNWDFDSIILGTSVLENTSAKEASEYLGGDFVNISLSGSSFFERKIVLNYALRKKELKKVLYSLDYLGDTARGRKGIYAISNWDYLYDYNPFNDFQAYINDKYLKCLFSFHGKQECMGRKVSLDRPNAWYKDKKHSERFGGLDHWFNVKNNALTIGMFNGILYNIKEIKAGHSVTDKDISKKIKMAKRYIDENLISIVKEHPQTQFIFVLPPYSRIWYALWAQYYKSNFELYKESLEYLVLKSEKYKNIEIYGWGTESFLDNVANYRDLDHYEYRINSWMLKAVKKKQGVLSTNNIDNYLNRITEKALNYDLSDLGKKIEKYLNTKAKINR